MTKIQSGYKAQPLSQNLNQTLPQPAPTIDFPKIDKKLAKTNIFEYLDFALQFAPPQENEREIRAQLAPAGMLDPTSIATSAESGAPREIKEWQAIMDYLRGLPVKTPGEPPGITIDARAREVRAIRAG